MKNKIIEECKKYGYEFQYEREESGLLVFLNKNVIEELQVFHIQINEDLEYVSMAIIIDLGSWNEATDSDLNNEEEIMKNISLWLSEESLKEVENWLNEEVISIYEEDRTELPWDYGKHFE